MTEEPASHYIAQAKLTADTMSFALGSNHMWQPTRDQYAQAGIMIAQLGRVIERMDADARRPASWCATSPGAQVAHARAAVQPVTVKPLRWSHSPVFGFDKYRGFSPFGEFTAFDGTGLTAEQIAAKQAEGDADYAKAILAALTPPLTVAGWQGIASAPKDGTDIMLGAPGRVTVGNWHVDEGGTTEHRDLDGRWVGQDDREPSEGWISWDGGFTAEHPPTHWMPLRPAPTPPASQTP